MSASTERKNRIAAREAGTDKKLLAQQEEARAKARSKRKWTLGTIGVVLLVALILLLNSSFLYTGTSAVRIGDRSYSPAEVGYAYANQYYTTASQYGNYASLFGLDTSAGPLGLKSQPCPMLDGGTWRDYFLDAAHSSLAQTQALQAYALEQGLALSDEDLADIDEQLSSLDTMASLYGYPNANKYLSANFGSHVNTKVVRAATEAGLLAGKGYDHYSDSLTYSDEELEDYYAGLNGESDYFNYIYYYVAAETTVSDTEGAESDGDAESGITEEALAEAKASAEAILAAYRDDKDSEDTAARFAAAVEGTLDEATGVSPVRTVGSSLNASFKDWLMDNRKDGDITVTEDANGEGYYAIAFLSREDNHYPTVSVRHILINAESNGDGTWSDEAKAAAKARAEEILAEWKAGEATEESFAALAEQYSEDAGSNTNGGLYENIYRNQMVQEFNDFCFGERKSGDTAVVYGSNGQYAGYHVIYFVGEGELYSSYLARTALTGEAVSSWLAEITPEAVPLFWEKLVG